MSTDKDEATRLADALERLAGDALDGREQRVLDEAAALLRRWPDGEPFGWYRPSTPPGWYSPVFTEGKEPPRTPREDILEGWMPLYTAPQSERIAALEAESANLRAVMVAAAEEIRAHWGAHCDAEGYGPANLMSRLEEGIAAQYGYTAGAFAEHKERIAALEAALEQARGAIEALRSVDVHSALTEDDADIINAKLDAALRAIEEVRR